VSDRELPPPVPSPFTGSVADYWRVRAEQHTQDTYAGVPISKFPEDLRVYEHLLWLAAPQVVIELGSQFGGSALWFRDRLNALAAYGRVSDPHVIAVDLEIERARETLDSHHHPGSLGQIDLLGGDVLDPALPAKVGELVRPGERCLVIEDSAHVYDTTYAALVGFSSFIPPGGFFIVEDGCVDVEEMRIEPSWPRGVLPAVGDWLAAEAGSGFQQRRELELYGLTCHPGGFLQRVS
jgi:cephalosporin hydroxylase